MSIKRLSLPSDPARPIIFGEVLFDCFEDGTATLGGAPFNVAWHLQGFGLEPLFISRVGEDELGRRILQTMDAWGMDMRAMQRDAHHPTGRVAVTLSRGQPAFEIVAEQAYDFIDPDMPLALMRRVPSPGLLYHGTLAARNPISREALAALRHEISVPLFVDVNLRAPWWDRDQVGQSLQGAAWVKLNDSELAALLQTPLEALDLSRCAQMLRREVAAQGLIVTLGARGALLATDDGVHVQTAPSVETIVDTVGAGDAFSAVAIVGLLRHWPVRALLERAVEFAASLCAIRGATPTDRTFYTSHMEKWGE